MNNLKEVLAVLRRGGIILYPTDTVWGLGGDATNPLAVEAITKLKHRSDHKSFICLVNGVGMLERYVNRVPDIAYQLIEVSTSPLTLVLPGGKMLASRVCGPDGSAAFRIPDHQFCQELLDAFGKPLLSTSANISGTEAPLCFADIDPDIVNGVDWCAPLEAQGDSTGKPSSIIAVGLSGEIKILR